jgi:hypothetical protein
MLPNAVLATAVGKHDFTSTMLGAFTPFTVIAARI